MDALRYEVIDYKADGRYSGETSLITAYLAGVDRAPLGGPTDRAWERGQLLFVDVCLVDAGGRRAVALVEVFKANLRAARAWEEGRFDGQWIPIEAPDLESVTAMPRAKPRRKACWVDAMNGTRMAAATSTTITP